MSSYSTVLFDLDGTLTDPYEGITRSVQYSLAKYGIEVRDRRLLECFIGPPLNESYVKYYGFSEEESYRAVDAYREYFAEKGIFENEVYPGIPETLARLKEAGKTLAVATSKPTVFAKRILERFDLEKYFVLCDGSELDGRRVHKDEVVAHAVNELKCPSGSVIMVGDRCHDVIGAKVNGIPTIGVSYGYGTREELEEAGAACVVDSVEELSTLLCQL